MTLTAPATATQAATTSAAQSQPAQQQPVAQAQPAAQSQPVAAQGGFPVDENTLNELVMISGASKEQARAAL